jgi:hypothetical protein
MREWNQIESFSGARNSECTTDYLFETRTLNELLNGKAANGNDQPRLECLYFVVQPGRAVQNFIRCGNAIAAGGILTRKTTANRGEIYICPDIVFAESAKSSEPFKQCSTGSPREGLLQHRLTWTGCLPNQHNFTNDGST